MKKLSSTTLACAAFCAVVLTVGAVDFAHTQSRVPGVPAPTCGADPGCNQARNADISDRVGEISILEDLYRSRAWLYSFGVIAAIAVATAASLRTRRRKDWPRVFNNLGVTGVWSGIGVTVLVVLTDDDVVSLPTAPVYAPSLAMLAAAAVGTVVGRSQDWGATDPVSEGIAGAKALGKRALGGVASQSPDAFGHPVSGPRREAAARWFTIVSLGLTAATIALALIFMGPQPACGGSDTSGAPAWTDTVGAAAGVTAIVAIAAGIGALLLRRWLVAVISLVANPIAVGLMIASTCAFY
jgi:hypothetical protein